jgi:hypothetical protein
MKKSVFGLLATSVVLASCNLLSGSNSGCYSYNKISEDGFQMSIDQSEIVLTVGSVANIGLKQSWNDIVNEKLVRRDITCRPDWSYVPTGIVEVDKENTKKLNALASGVSQVTAKVEGYSKQADSFWVLVNPLVTETNQPNDTFELANEVGSSVIGTTPASDLDFYKFVIPADKKYRIELINSVELNNVFSGSYRASFFDANKATISTAVQNRLEGSNITNLPITIVVRVENNNWSTNDTPYKLSLELF